MESSLVKVAGSSFTLRDPISVEVVSTGPTSIYLSSLSQSTREPVRIIKSSDHLHPVHVVSGRFSNRSTCQLVTRSGQPEDIIMMGCKGRDILSLRYDAERDVWREC